MQGQTSMTDICIRYGISRKTAYKWYHRFLEQGEEGLKDLSKALIPLINSILMFKSTRLLILNLNIGLGGQKKF